MACTFAGTEAALILTLRVNPIRPPFDSGIADLIVEARLLWRERAPDAGRGDNSRCFARRRIASAIWGAVEAERKSSRDKLGRDRGVGVYEKGR